LPAPSLAELYQQAAEATAKGSKSFYFATRFFPPELARAAHAVYWFCRHTDDLVDECPSIEEGRRQLEEWAALLKIAQHSAVDHPVLTVFLDTARRYQIPMQYPFELIEGMRMDLNQTRYETFEELRVFCYRVASVVGLMMCWVIGFENPDDREKAAPYAIDLGIGLQLTNILRDVGEDLGRNRIYIPREDLRRFDYSEDDLRAHRRTPQFEELMKFQAARARSYYERGNAGIPLLHHRGRFAVKVASDVYREILNRVEASNYDVFDNRTVVPAARKYWLTARNMAMPILRSCAPALSHISYISSLAALVGLAAHYLSHYVTGAPLLTDQIAEWIMARTPSRYTVAILQYLGPWAKPSAVTGALALLGGCLFIARLIPKRAFALFCGVAIAVAVALLFDYHSIVGSCAFWIPALAFSIFVNRPVEPQPVSLQRRMFLMAGGVVAVAGESYLREDSLARRARQPLDLFPFQPPLDRARFGSGLVRKALTPVPEFYGMSKNTVDPTVDPQSWRLLISLDGKPLRTFGYGELLGLPKQIRYVTLRCISNTLKSDLMGTAIWAGVHLSQLIDRRALPSNVIEAAFIGVEGHDDSLRIDYAFSEESLLTLGMNGKTLSRTHGFPIRLLAPNYYGCRNVKWIREIRFVTKPYYGTWQRLGYTKEPLIHICSHIDRIRRDGPLLEFGGVSFAGTRGIKSVRVRSNGGPWQAARLEPALSPYTWTRWVAQLPAVEGSVLEANAQDSSGNWQDLNEAGPFPSGMSGPTIVVART
jgi:phytoene synthase